MKYDCRIVSVRNNNYYINKTEGIIHLDKLPLHPEIIKATWQYGRTQVSTDIVVGTIRNDTLHAF